MAYYGYHRISTKEQHLDRGIIEIKRFCENQKIKLESIFTDKIKDIYMLMVQNFKISRFKKFEKQLYMYHKKIFCLLQVLEKI